MSIVLARTARAGSSGLAISFLRAGRGAAGEYSFRNAATQAELAERARPAAVYSLWPQRWLPYALTAAKKRKMRPGDILGALTGDIGLDGAGYWQN
ncbi:ATP-dependent RNA helicase [Salmonella enterica subsp. enterica]|uniref:ATP-dependent RNA helicase n=1 Tax=Salmonella enterica I TaxID=59201 RepID=A0A447U2S6_SALET|nr:ATP-dependent RNA helicase [Salmonella enterica subsp. enterica]